MNESKLMSDGSEDNIVLQVLDTEYAQDSYNTQELENFIMQGKECKITSEC